MPASSISTIETLTHLIFKKISMKGVLIHHFEDEETDAKLREVKVVEVVVR